MNMDSLKFGDIVVSKHGRFFKFLGKYPHIPFPEFMVHTANIYPYLLFDLGADFSSPFVNPLVNRVSGGFVYLNESSRLDIDHDIVRKATDEEIGKIEKKLLSSRFLKKYWAKEVEQ